MDPLSAAGRAWPRPLTARPSHGASQGGCPARPRLRSHQRSLGIDISSSVTIATTVVTAKTNSGVRAIDSQTIAAENSAAHRYMISTLARCECPMSSSR